MELGRLVMGQLPRHSTLAAGLGAALTLLTVVLASQGGVFWTRFEIELAPPPSAYAIPGVEKSLVATAATVVTAVNGEPMQAAVASSEATLYGQGVRRGKSVTLKDTGGQWENAYAAPVIQVEVVGDSARTVQARAKGLHQRIVTTLASTQRHAGVGPNDRIVATDYGIGPDVIRVGGSHVRGTAAILTLGGVATFLIVARLRSREGPLHL